MAEKATATIEDNQELTALLACKSTHDMKLKKYADAPPVMRERIKREAEQVDTRIKALQSMGAKPIT